MGYSNFGSLSMETLLNLSYYELYTLWYMFSEQKNKEHKEFQKAKSKLNKNQ